MIELYTALLECQRLIKPVYKGSKGNFGQFANYEDVMIASRPHMLAYQLEVSHHRRDTDAGLYLQTIIRHAPTGQQIDDLVRLTPEKQTPSSIGAAETYAKRRSFVNIMGIVTTDVDNVDSGECEDAPVPSGTNGNVLTSHGGFDVMGVISEEQIAVLERFLSTANAEQHKRVLDFMMARNGTKYIEDIKKNDFQSIMNILKPRGV